MAIPFAIVFARPEDLEIFCSIVKEGQKTERIPESFV